jgi:hypothetical protein
MNRPVETNRPSGKAWVGKSIIEQTIKISKNNKMAWKPGRLCRIGEVSALFKRCGSVVKLLMYDCVIVGYSFSCNWNSALAGFCFFKGIEGRHSKGSSPDRLAGLGSAGKGPKPRLGER